MQTQTPTIVPPPPLLPARHLLLLIASTLLIQALLRGWVAGEILIAGGIEGQLGGLVHWRVFDGFIGWIALMILALNDDLGSKGRVPLYATLAAGVAAFSLSLLLGEVGGRAIVEIAVAGLLAIAGTWVALRQIAGLARAGKSGLNIEQLWRGIAAQWVLLWIAAEISLRLRFWKEGVESEETARSLLFILPALGVMPNILMAVGIRWATLWRDDDQKTGNRPRVRAWLVALILLNFGIVCTVIGTIWARGLGVAGAGVIIAGIALYGVGFPTNAWAAVKTKGGGWLVPSAFGLLIVGLLMLGIELAMLPSDVKQHYSSAWRHLIGSVELLWLLGMGSIALQRRVPARIAAGTHVIAAISRACALLGVLCVAGIFLLAALWERDAIRGIFLGTTLQIVGILLAAAITARATLALRTRGKHRHE